jgi:hypothetical protein
MPDAIDIHGTVFKNGSVTLLARVVSAGGTNIVPAGINTVTYTVYLLDDQNPDGRTAVDGHTNLTLAVADVLFGALQTDATWTVDTTGYNFRHVLDVSIHQAFAIAGRRYLVEYLIQPAVGQNIVVRFRINAI